MPLRIINKTKNVILAEEAAVADTPFKRIKGLLGENSLAQNRGLIIRPCNSIHTFFMKFPIDAVFVNSANTIVKIIPNMAPFRLSNIYWKAKFVVELPAGTAEKTPSQIGDILEISPLP